MRSIRLLLAIGTAMTFGACSSRSGNAPARPDDPPVEPTYPEDDPGETPPIGDGGVPPDAADAGDAANDTGDAPGPTCPANLPTGWQPVASAPIPAGFDLYQSQLVWDGTRAYLVGLLLEDVSPGANFRDWYGSYDPRSDTWTELPPPPFGTGGRYPDAIAADGRLFVWGGNTRATSEPVAFRNGAIFDGATGRWIEIPDAPIVGRAEATIVWSTTTRELIVWGGSTGPFAQTVDDIVQYDDGAAFDPDTGSWRLLADSPLSPRAARGAWTGTNVAILGGALLCEGCPVLGDGATYDPVTDTWSTLTVPATYGARRNDVGEQLPPTRAAFFGGIVEPGELPRSRNDGVIFDAATRGFAIVPEPPVGTLERARLRIGQASWVANGTLSVWGGLGADETGSNRWFDDGATYFPSTRSWTALPPGGPSERGNASAVWTGCEAIVYGGNRLNDRFNDGMIFRP